MSKKYEIPIKIDLILNDTSISDRMERYCTYCDDNFSCNYPYITCHDCLFDYNNITEDRKEAFLK